MSKSNTWSTNITMITFRNIVMILITWPLTVIFRKIPKICRGSNGMITASINMVIIFWKSLNASRSVLPLI